MVRGGWRWPGRTLGTSQPGGGILTTCTCTVHAIGGFAKRAHPARARYLNVNLARRNRDLQPGGKEIEGGGRGGEEEEEEEEKSDSW